MKKERAALTVEASIILTIFMFFVLFLLSFNRVYSAQNIMSHATLQAADAISAESMLRENANISAQGVGNILTVSNHIYNGESIEAAALERLTNSNIKVIAKKDFIAAVAESESKADEVLKENGIKNGLGGLDFSGCKYYSDSGETIVFVKYTVELQFPIFGLREFPMTKAAKVTNMGKETYTVTVKAQNPAHGTTSGTVRVRKGGQTTIQAKANHGYQFVRWIEDGSTAYKRDLTVNSDLTYTAVFKKAFFSVIAEVNNDNWGKTTGSGSYNLDDIATLTATSKVNGGYKFCGWDENGNDKIDDDESTEATLKIKVRRDVKVKAIFKPIPYQIKVITGGRGIAILKSGTNNLKTNKTAGNTVSLTLDYGTKFTIDAQSSDYPFVGWAGSASGKPAKKDLTVPVGGGTYTAKFEEPYVRITTNINIAIAGSVTSANSSVSTEQEFFRTFGISNSMKLNAATNIINAKLSWSSSNSNVVSVDQSGNITAKGIGTATISVSTKTTDGEKFTGTKKVVIKRLLVEINYRANKDVRHYRDKPVEGNWKNIYQTSYWWFYRYQFVDSLPNNTVAPGQYSGGHLHNPYPYGSKPLQDGYNKSSQTAYVVFWDYFQDVLMYDKGIKIQYVGD